MSSNRSTPRQAADGIQEEQAPLRVEFSNDEFLPPTPPSEGHQELEVLLRRQNPLPSESLVHVLAPNSVAMHSHCEDTLALLDRCKSGDTSLALHEIAGHALEFSIDEQGSQFLQEMLEGATYEEMDAVFQEIRHYVLYLATHVFGNCVLRKFFYFGAEVHICQLSDELVIQMDKLAVNIYGSCVIIAALEVITVDERLRIANEVGKNVIWWARNGYGCDVILKIIDYVPEDLIGFLTAPLATDAVSLSTHPVAYLVIAKLLMMRRYEESPERAVMITNILDAMHTMSYDEFGSHIVQLILGWGKLHERTAIIQRLAGNVMQMISHQFASLVVVKCLHCGGPQERWLLVNEILTIIDAYDGLKRMMTDKHAIKVFQNALLVGSNEQYQVLLTKLGEH